LADADFLVDRKVALGNIDSECEVEETDSNLLIKMKRTRELDLPDFLTNVLGGNPVFSTEEQWKVVEDHFKGSSTTVVGGQSGTVCTEFSTPKTTGSPHKAQ
jgi:hypothetical protein